MALSPQWKFFEDGVYKASFKDVIHAIVLSDWIGEGRQIRYGHKKVVWDYNSSECAKCRCTEGASAGYTNYDQALDLIWQKMGWNQ